MMPIIDMPLEELKRISGNKSVALQILMSFGIVPSKR
jgi:hypothetical protein